MLTHTIASLGMYPWMIISLHVTGTYLYLICGESFFL